ncbi:MAG: two pore domain potassium channel family protein [Flavobacteriales bacterium]|nr:two pore domain potassium channel family protein [Flavobacteriales bacterium]
MRTYKITLLSLICLFAVSAYSQIPLEYINYDEFESFSIPQGEDPKAFRNRYVVSNQTILGTPDQNLVYIGKTENYAKDKFASSKTFNINRPKLYLPNNSFSKVTLENNNFPNGIRFSYDTLKSLVINQNNFGIPVLAIINCKFDVLEINSPMMFLMVNSTIRDLKVNIGYHKIADTSHFSEIAGMLVMDSNRIENIEFNIIEDNNDFQLAQITNNVFGVVPSKNRQAGEKLVHENAVLFNQKFSSGSINQPFSHLEFINNRIDANPGAGFKFDGYYANLSVLYNSFDQPVDMSTVVASEKFRLIGNEFNKEISFTHTIFSEFRNELNWNQFKVGELCSFEYPHLFTTDEDLLQKLGASKWIYTGRETSDIELFDNFDQLVSSYIQLFHIYKSREDVESANMTYAKMKEVETRKWQYRYEQDKTFESFFRWQLNSFLSYFTDYGTNPAKAVVKSGWVILLFSIFYIFFPSDWDITSRSQFLQNIKSLASKNREKSFIMALLFVIYIGFVNIINALTLSMNAFTTLGFGDIPTHGAARYVTIIEGLIGWFLLTIFSVSLINQVLG